MAPRKQCLAKVLMHMRIHRDCDTMNITYTGSDQKNIPVWKVVTTKMIFIIDTCQERGNWFSPIDCLSVCIWAAMLHSRPHVQEYLINTKQITRILCVCFLFLLAFAIFHLIGFVFFVLILFLCLYF